MQPDSHRRSRGKMLLILVSLLCGVPAAELCLQCDTTITRIHEDFILSAPTVNEQIELQKICDYAYVTYKETSQVREGVIGESTQSGVWICVTLLLLGLSFVHIFLKISTVQHYF